jgi:single-strand DNA-binding protein
MSVNKVIVIGKLTTDVEIISNPTYGEIAVFSVQTHDKYYDKHISDYKECTDVHTVEVWGSMANYCKTYLHKGSNIYLEGSMRVKQIVLSTGEEIRQTVVFSKSINFLPNKLQQATNLTEKEKLRGLNNKYYNKKNGYDKLQHHRHGDY